MCKTTPDFHLLGLYHLRLNKQVSQNQYLFYFSVPKKENLTTMEHLYALVIYGQGIGPSETVRKCSTLMFFGRRARGAGIGVLQRKTGTDMKLFLFLLTSE